MKRSRNTPHVTLMASAVLVLTVCRPFRADKPIGNFSAADEQNDSTKPLSDSNKGNPNLRMDQDELK